MGFDVPSKAAKFTRPLGTVHSQGTHIETEISYDRSCKHSQVGPLPISISRSLEPYPLSRLPRSVQKMKHYAFLDVDESREWFLSCTPEFVLLEGFFNMSHCLNC